MIRLIKRYESRKLYDTEESRYVSLDEISKWIREGQEVKVLDNGTSSDVTAQTLTQIILDEGRKGTSFLPTDLLHELVRAGERAVSSGVEQVQSSVDRFVKASIDRFGPVRRAREEMSTLRARLEQLESSLVRLEESGDSPNGEVARAKSIPRKTTARKRTTKTASTKTSSTKKTSTAQPRGTTKSRETKKS